MRSSSGQYLALAAFLGICLGVAAVASRLTLPSIEGWYASLRKPSWTPPDWLFGPVWTVLYVMMGVAAWLVWRRAGLAGSAGALALFALQLALNGLWSGLFFALRSPAAAFVDIVLLWFAIAATLVSFWRIVPAAAWLLAPYLAWVTFAMALNFAIWRRNA